MSVSYVSAALRKSVRKRANECCEYCLIPENLSFAAHQVDHIIAEKHGGLTIESNLALSCTLCNKRKGSDIASIDEETGKIAPLFNPRIDARDEHFRIENYRFVGLTAESRATIRLLQLNSAGRIEERRISENYGQR